jgi:uncharacterized protein (DUF433 family)
METKIAYKYIVIKSANNESVIEGTRISVRDIVEQWGLGSAPEGITSIYPHLNLSKIFEALVYYQDNMSEIEHFIKLSKLPESSRGNSLSL